MERNTTTATITITATEHIASPLLTMFQDIKM
jgi:hypothetical protein